MASLSVTGAPSTMAKNRRPSVVRRFFIVHELCESLHLPGPSRLSSDKTSHGDAAVRGDPTLLDIALRNLVHNALKYSPADRPVRIELRRDEDHIDIDVSDAGAGISPLDAPPIFDDISAPKAHPRCREPVWAFTCLATSRVSTAVKSRSKPRPSTAPCSGCDCPDTATPERPTAP